MKELTEWDKHYLESLLVEGGEARELETKESTYLKPFMERRILKIADSFASDGKISALREELRYLVKQLLRPHH